MMNETNEKEVAGLAEVTEVNGGKEKKQISPYKIVTFWTSVALSILFVLDLVLFLMNMLEWYIFVALLGVYLVVFPIALLVIYRSSKSQGKNEIALEIESEILARTSEPDLTKIYEE